MQLVCFLGNWDRKTGNCGVNWRKMEQKTVVYKDVEGVEQLKIEID